MNTSAVAGPFHNDDSLSGRIEKIEERPERPIEINKIEHIQIKQLNYGYFVKVGCHDFAIETKEKLIDSLIQYVNNPKKITELWNDNKFLER